MRDAYHWTPQQIGLMTWAQIADALGMRAKALPPGITEAEIMARYERGKKVAAAAYKAKHDGR